MYSKQTYLSMTKNEFIANSFYFEPGDILTHNRVNEIFYFPNNSKINVNPK